MCPINVVRDSGIATTATSGLLATGGGEFSEIFAAQQKQQQQQQHPKELRHHRQHQQKHRPQSSDQQHFSEQHLEHQSLQQQHFLDHQPNEQPYDLHLHHLHHQHQHHTQHQQEQQQQQFEQQLFASNTTATASDSLYGWDENYASSSSSHALALLSPTTMVDVAIPLPQNDTGDAGLNSFYFYETEQFTVLWILFAVIVLGNSAVLVTMHLNANQKSRMNFFIKQLAIADLCVGLLNVLTDIVWRITVSWRAGNVACKCIKFVQGCVMYASTYVLVALSIDRYDAITHPMNFSGSWRRARRLVAAAWALSACFSIPMLILYEERTIQNQTQCWIELGEPWRWQLYMSLIAGALFVLPAIIITACYAIIIRTIWAKGAMLVTTADKHKALDRDCRRASSRGIIPRAKIKTVKMTIVIVIVFIVCWSPYIIFDLLQVFECIPKTQTNIAIATFIQSLAPLNSAANPLIYCLFSAQVCRVLRKQPLYRWMAYILCGCRARDDPRGIDGDNGGAEAVGRNGGAGGVGGNGDGLGGGGGGAAGGNGNGCRGDGSGGGSSGGSGSGGGGGGYKGCLQNGGGIMMRTSTDSMRTPSTSLSMSKRSSSGVRPAHIVIVERPKVHAMSEV